MDKTDRDRSKSSSDWHSFHHQVKLKSDRKIKARKEPKQIWFGLGLFGMVGWSVAIPSLMGISLGIWLDSKIESKYSWTLMLLVVGVALGCFNAWYWISKESRGD